MKLVTNTLEALLDDGFTKRFAIKYLEDINGEDPSLYDPVFFEWAHTHGFLASHAIGLGLNDDNLSDYLSDYDYYRSWPNDSWLRAWHNDKLTLKYMLNGTSFSDYMPEYYYYYLPSFDSIEGGLRRLIDCPLEEQTYDSFVELLRQKKVLACKPNNGGRSVGFHRLSYDEVEKKFYIDNSFATENDIINFVKNNPNYIYTEYMVAGGGLEKIHKGIHTIRINIVNENGIDPYLVGAYVRFPYNSKVIANYGEVMYLCNVNIENGNFENGTIWYPDKLIQQDTHPENGVLAIGTIPEWAIIVDDCLNMSKLFFGTNIFGFDIGITPEGPKLMEINTFPGTGYLQYYYPLMKNERFRRMISKRLDYLNNLSVERKKERNKIV